MEYIENQQKATQREAPEPKHQVETMALRMIVIAHIVPAND